MKHANPTMPLLKMNKDQVPTHESKNRGGIRWEYFISRDIPKPQTVSGDRPVFRVALCYLMYFAVSDVFFTSGTCFWSGLSKHAHAFLFA